MPVPFGGRFRIVYSCRLHAKRNSNLARPVDYRKTRGSKRVHTEDEHVPIGKKDQARQLAAKDQKVEIAARQSGSPLRGETGHRRRGCEFAKNQISSCPNHERLSTGVAPRLPIAVARG